MSKPLPQQQSPLLSPYPWFGGKSRITPLVWSRFGDVQNYVEAFYGSGAVHLARPQPFDGTETINDSDGLVANFWRAVAADPDQVAHYADWPVNENDLHARHAWLVQRKDALPPLLEGNPDYHDPKIAGWWVWGICSWIGSGWCSGNGPWQVAEVDGERQLVHLGDAGRGEDTLAVDALPTLNGSCEEWSEHLRSVMRSLSDRLRRVRVCCGDWSRVCGPTPTVKQGLTAVLLDPPYSHAERQSGLYNQEMQTAENVRTWALQWGGDKRIRIALCGYEGEHAMPDDWECVRWKTKGGYGSQGEGRGRENAGRECVWFSPHCVRQQRSLFDL